MANHGDLSPPADGGSHQQPIPILYEYGRTPEGTPLSYFLYYKPFSSTRRPVYEDGTTKVICLYRMVSPDQFELEDDECYRKFCRRVTQEGQRHGGKLVRIVVPRPDPSGAPVAGVGKVFLEYADIDSSAYSKGMLHWMRFQGRQVIAVFFAEDKFANGDYDA